jgi:hypothetical protein
MVAADASATADICNATATMRESATLKTGASLQCMTGPPTTSDQSHLLDVGCKRNPTAETGTDPDSDAPQQQDHAVA